MGDPMRRDAPATATGAGVPDAAATDLVWVCRSATLPRAAYRFYRALLLTFPARGGPPDRATLRRLARCFGVDLDPTLATLATHDLVQRDPATGGITTAYPFSGVPRPHRVTLLGDPAGSSGVQVYAMCALDALSIPLMLRRSALVASVDPLTGESVRVRIWRADGAAGGEESDPAGWRAEWEPATGLVYARPEDPSADARDIAAACRCPVTNFFAAPAHAHRWAERHGAPGDVLLAPAEALQRAERRFGGLLDRLAGVDGQRSTAG
jgi:hypothetical protein